MTSNLERTLAASVAQEVVTRRPLAPTCTCDTLVGGWLCTHCRVANAQLALDESLDAYLAELELDRFETDQANRALDRDAAIEAR